MHRKCGQIFAPAKSALPPSLAVVCPKRFTGQALPRAQSLPRAAGFFCETSWVWRPKALALLAGPALHRSGDAQEVRADFCSSATAPALLYLVTSMSRCKICTSAQVCPATARRVFATLSKRWATLLMAAGVLLITAFIH